MKTVLIVEDEESVRSVVAEGIRKAGYAVTEVRLASESIDLLKQTTPALIVLDLSMPKKEMSGIDLLFKIREAEAWKEIPVVILSGIGDLVDKDAATHLRVDALFSKPVALSELTGKIHQILGR
jgi:two-component system response regulator RegX3